MFCTRRCALRPLTRAVVVCALLGAAQLGWGADVIINSPTTQNTDYTVNGNLLVVGSGSLTVNGFLHVNNGIANSASPPGTGISATGTLFAGGDVGNDAANVFVVRGPGASSVLGTLNNRGFFSFGNGIDAAQLNAGALSNAAGAELTFLTRATLNVAGAIDNAGDVTFQMADFQLAAGSTLNNSGTWNLANGAFNCRGLMSGNGQLDVNGTATFFSGSLLQGNPTVTASTLYLQGTVAPGGVGTPGQMVFNADTHFQGLTEFDLLAPGHPGVGNDRILISGGQTATLESGTQFDFHLVNAPGHIGDRYEILHGNVALQERPVATDDVNSRRIVLRTDRDLGGFSNQGSAYYALVARDASLEQIAWANGGRGNAITMGRYLDLLAPLDDHSIGTANADLQWIRDTLDLMPAEASVARALGQMAGEVYMPLELVALQRQFFAYTRFAGRLREDLFRTDSMDHLPYQGAVPPAEPGDDRSAPGGPAGAWPGLPIRGWISGYGFGGTINGDFNAAGGSFGGGGVQAAFGYQPSERFGFGIFYDFGTFNLDNEYGDKADVQAHSWGGYAAWHRDVDYFLFVGGGGFANYHVTRYIELDNPDNVLARRAQAEPLGGQAAFYGEYGRDFTWENAHLRPYLGLLYMYVRQNSFAETGAGGLDLSFEDAAIDSFRTLLGGQFDFRYSPLANVVWTLQGAWVHEYVNAATGGTLTASLAALPNTNFVAARPTIGRDSMMAGCGVRGTFFGEHIRPFANYDLAGNAHYFFQAVWGGLEYVW